MYEIYFYEDKDGNSAILNYLNELSKKADKNSRVKHNKINDYIQVLSEYGNTVGEPYIKHIDGDIWELRPIRSRIFFASWTKNGFIREIDQAKRNLKDIRERSDNNENMERC